MQESKSKAGASPLRQRAAQPRAASNSRPAAPLAAPCPIRFTRAICGDLGQAERREWWIANGLGGYAGGTIAGSLTRRYHGLLIAPVGIATRAPADPRQSRCHPDRGHAGLGRCSPTDGRAAPSLRRGMSGSEAFISTTPFRSGPTRSTTFKSRRASGWSPAPTRPMRRGVCGRPPSRRRTGCRCGSPCSPTIATTTARRPSAALRPRFASMASVSCSPMPGSFR